MTGASRSRLAAIAVVVALLAAVWWWVSGIPGPRGPSGAEPGNCTTGTPNADGEVLVFCVNPGPRTETALTPTAVPSRSS
jgi:hypothetical protein